MKNYHLFICVGLFACQLQAVALADTSESSSASPSNSASVPEGDSSVTPPLPVPTTGGLAARELPKLVLSWNCGDCEHNEKVLPLIEQEYAKQAVAMGYTVSPSETAELSITAYRQRSPGMRAMFGIFAGKDVLNTRVVFRGKEFVADDYSANAILGMNSLCAAVAQKAVSQIAASL